MEREGETPSWPGIDDHAITGLTLRTPFIQVLHTAEGEEHGKKGSDSQGFRHTWRQHRHTQATWLCFRFQAETRSYIPQFGRVLEPPGRGPALLLPA